MTCKQADDNLVRYVFDDLDGRDKEQYLAHLEECETCRTAVTDVLATVQLLREGLEEMPSPALSADRRSILVEAAARTAPGAALLPDLERPPLELVRDNARAAEPASPPPGAGSRKNPWMAVAALALFATCLSSVFLSQRLQVGSAQGRLIGLLPAHPAPGPASRPTLTIDGRVARPDPGELADPATEDLDPVVRLDRNDVPPVHKPDVPHEISEADAAAEVALNLPAPDAPGDFPPAVLTVRTADLPAPVRKRYAERMQAERERLLRVEAGQGTGPGDATAPPHAGDVAASHDPGGPTAPAEKPPSVSEMLAALQAAEAPPVVAGFTRSSDDERRVMLTGTVPTTGAAAERESTPGKRTSPVATRSGHVAESAIRLATAKSSAPDPAAESATKAANGSRPSADPAAPPASPKPGKAEARPADTDKPAPAPTPGAKATQVAALRAANGDAAKPPPPLQLRSYAIGKATLDAVRTATKPSGAPENGGAPGEERFRRFFSDRGVSFPPGATLVYDQRSGKLAARNTPANLRKIEGTLRRTAEKEHR